MRAATHLALAGLTGVLASGFGATPDMAGGAALAVGSLLPDIDTTNSGLGRFIKPVSGLIERRFGHRTLTHSLLGLLIVAALSSPLLVWQASVFWWLLVGMFSHMLLDTANIVGVPLLYPLRLQFWMMPNRSWRVAYNSPTEFTWLGCLAVASVALLPLSLDGFTPWFHRMLGTPYGAVEDFLRWYDRFEVWADIKGHNLVTNQQIDGRYRVIDAPHTEQLLIEDDAGRAYTVGLGQSSDIVSKSIKVWRGQEIVTATYRLDLTGRLVSDLINSLPKGAKQTHMNAALVLSGTGDTPPVVGYFERVKKFGDEYEIRSATAGDLAPLAHMVIESGSAVIRAEYPKGSETLANLSLSSTLPEVKSHLLSIPNLPSLAGLVVKLGDEVAEGELIARYLNDEVLASSKEELEAAQARIPELETSIELERQAHEARLAVIEQSISEATTKLDKMRFLVERDAEPRARLVEAEAALKRAENTKIQEETTWTSQLNTLQSQIREANLTISRAERNLQSEMNTQWVKAPVSGTISDIRLAGVTTKGVNLEVMILEEMQPEAEVEPPLPYSETEAALRVSTSR
jgi:inner membrane protein